MMLSMALMEFHSLATDGAAKVLWLFLVPVGGGIPSGVLHAKSQGLGWPVMAGLYLLSDVILACVFEPLMLLVILAGRRSRFFARLSEVLKQAAARSTAHFGTKMGPLGLVMVSFGVDPMTGRATAKAMGHGFISGWALAIAGDMLYFGVLAYSTLALNQVLDEMTTTIIILAAMFLLPVVVRRVRQVFARS